MIRLAYDGSYDWGFVAGWLAARTIAGVDTVTADGAYVRAINFDGEPATLEVRASDRSELLATIRSAGAPAPPLVVDRVRRMFDLDADLAVINAHLATDPLLAPLIARRPGLRVPGAWDGYELAVRAVLGQQISVGAASKLAGRLVERFGAPLPLGVSEEPAVHRAFPLPHVLAEADVASLGMPRARAASVHAVARAAANDPSFFEPTHDLERAIERLRSLPGIGEWTANYIAMRALREPDAFPAADVGLMRALARDGVRPSWREVLARSQRWRPFRAYAALHLWAADGDRP